MNTGSCPRPGDDKDICEYVQGVQEKLDEAHDAARVHLKKAAQHQKCNYDHKCEEVQSRPSGLVPQSHFEDGQMQQVQSPMEG